jgi:hypothetical protein
MRKDIEIKEVTDIVIALVPRTEDEEFHDFFWDAWLVNLKPQPVKSVMINSTGYGERNGEHIRTSTMRYFWEEIESGMAVKIEPVQIDLLDLASEFWLSFSFEDYLYDRKFVFTPGANLAGNFSTVPILEKPGVVIR